MNIHEVARPVRWQVDNRTPSGGRVSIAGWDFGGNGPPALLHHANGMCGALWALVATRLTERYRVFAVDARGHGDSSRLQVPEDYPWSAFVDDLVAVARQVRDACAAPAIELGVGSSMGGIVTAGAQARTGDLFRRIVMLDPPIHPDAELIDALGLDLAPEPNRRAGLIEQTLRRRAVWPNRAQARDAWAGKPLFAAWRPEAFALYLSEGMEDLPDGQVRLKCAPQLEAHIFASTGSLGLMEYAPLVDVPVAVVHARDGFFPHAFFQAVARQFPRGRLHQMQGGHMLPLEVPERVSAYLLDSTR